MTGMSDQAGISMQQVYQATESTERTDLEWSEVQREKETAQKTKGSAHPLGSMHAGEPQSKAGQTAWEGKHG